MTSISSYNVTNSAGLWNDIKYMTDRALKVETLGTECGHKYIGSSQSDVLRGINHHLDGVRI